jgi:hypothetical protein
MDRARAAAAEAAAFNDIHFAIRSAHIDVCSRLVTSQSFHLVTLCNGPRGACNYQGDLINCLLS